MKLSKRAKKKLRQAVEKLKSKKTEAQIEAKPVVKEKPHDLMTTDVIGDAVKYFNLFGKENG